MKENSAVRQIFYGQCTFNNIGRDEKVLEYQKEADGYYRELREKLKAFPELSDLLLKYDESEGKAHAEDLLFHYSEGFKFGLLTGVEACESGLK